MWDFTPYFLQEEVHVELYTLFPPEGSQCGGSQCQLIFCRRKSMWTLHLIFCRRKTMLDFTPYFLQESQSCRKTYNYFKPSVEILCKINGE